MLVAMATGTGKTFTLVNEIYRLMKSGVAPRILFLVDRRALAAQAVRAFASFEAEQGLKFDKVYEVYSQRFQKEDFGEEEKFDPKVLLCLANCYEGPFLPLIALRECDEFHFRNASVAGNRSDRGSALQ